MHAQQHVDRCSFTCTTCVSHEHMCVCRVRAVLGIGWTKFVHAVDRACVSHAACSAVCVTASPEPCAGSSDSLHPAVLLCVTGVYDAPRLCVSHVHHDSLDICTTIMVKLFRSHTDAGDRTTGTTHNIDMCSTCTCMPVALHVCTQHTSAHIRTSHAC